MKKVIVCVLVLILCLTAFFACNPIADEQPNTAALSAAKALLDVQYKDAAKETPVDYVLWDKVVGGGVTFNITWTISITTDGVAADAITLTKTDEGWAVDVPELGDNVISYTITANYTDGKVSTGSVSYNREVPKFKVNTPADYYAAEKGASLTVDGYITGIISKALGDQSNSLYVQDATAGAGGYYVYNISDEHFAAVNPVVGMKVRVVGEYDVYNGTHELINANIQVLDSNPTVVAPIDFTSIYTNAETLKAEELVGKQGMLVTIKDVTIGAAGENGYKYFTLGDKQSYVRISSSSCPLNAADTAAFEAAFAEKQGWIADVTGVICIYSGNFYLTPVDVNAINYKSLPQLDDAGMVAFEKDALTVVSAVEANGDINLPLAGVTYGEVVISWQLEENAVATLNQDTGVLTVTLGAEATTINLTATLTCNGTQDTVQFAIKVSSAFIDWKDVAWAVEEAGKLETGASSSESYYFYGYVGEITNPQYSNFYLVDGKGNSILVYGVRDAEGNRYGTKDGFKAFPYVQGDLICLKAVIKNFNGTLELDSVVEQPIPAVGTVAWRPFDAATALEMAGQLADNAISDDWFYFAGTVMTEPTANYCNFNLGTEASSILVYGLAATKGGDRYGTSREIAEIPFVAGDSLVVYAKVQKYVKSDGTVTPELVGTAVLVSVTPATAGMTDAEVVAKVKSELSLSKEAIADFELPTSKDAEVVWAVKSGDAIVINGANAVVTRGAADAVVVLTATITKGEASDTVDFDVTVKAAASSTSQHTISFEDVNNRTGFSTDSQVWAQDGITFTNAKGSSTSNVGDYSNPVRCYKSSSVTVECAGMTQVVFTTASDKKFTTETIEGATIVVDGATTTITFASPVDSFTFTCASQIRIYSIVITCEVA